MDWTLAEQDNLLEHKLQQIAEIKKQRSMHGLDQQLVASCSAMIEDISKDLALMQEISELRVIQRYCEIGAEDDTLGQSTSPSTSDEEDDWDDVFLK